MSTDKFTTREVYSPLKIAMDVANRYGEIPQVMAVVLGGSHSVQRADSVSDIDLYVYSSEEIPHDARYNLAASMGKDVEINNQFWENGDEWIDAESSFHIDVTFRNTKWIEEQLDRVLKHHEASLGYTTALWYNVLNSNLLVDHEGWFSKLQTKAKQPYPDELREAIIRKNHRVLRRSLSSYYYQIRLAVSRKDPVSINHRVAALLASYFDIVLAVNLVLHPGEKQLLTLVDEQCKRKPDNMRIHVNQLLKMIAQDDMQVIRTTDLLLDGLDAFLKAEKLDKIL
ncbi:MAG: DUF4037 domain-containing protein [Chloroflexi bacterium]|nr:MAG: DUF4037 domain-containing protein [Chloroflexota bacterium]